MYPEQEITLPDYDHYDKYNMPKDTGFLIPDKFNEALLHLNHSYLIFRAPLEID
jgi:hypothetical protein